MGLFAELVNFIFFRGGGGILLKFGTSLTIQRPLDDFKNKF